MADLDLGESRLRVVFGLASQGEEEEEKEEEEKEKKEKKEVKMGTEGGWGIDRWDPSRRVETLNGMGSKDKILVASREPFLALLPPKVASLAI